MERGANEGDGERGLEGFGGLSGPSGTDLPEGEVGPQEERQQLGLEARAAVGGAARDQDQALGGRQAGARRETDLAELGPQPGEEHVARLAAERAASSSATRTVSSLM